VVTVTDCTLERFDVEDAEGGFIYRYHGFLEADDADDLDTAMATINAFKCLVGEPAAEHLGRSPVKHKMIYYIQFSLQGDT